MVYAFPAGVEEEGFVMGVLSQKSRTGNYSTGRIYDALGQAPDAQPPDPQAGAVSEEPVCAFFPA